MGQTPGRSRLMNDLSETLARFRLPLRRDRLKQARAFAAPVVRYAPKNPFILIGAGLLAVAGILAWTQRDRIAAKAGPLLEDAKAKGMTLMDEAMSKSQTLIDGATAKGHDLLEVAKAQGEAVADKVARVRRGAADRLAPPDVH